MNWTQIHKYTNTQIHKYTNTQIHKYTNTDKHIYNANDAQQSILYAGGPPCPNAAMNHDYTLWCNAQFAYSITISECLGLTLQYSIHRVHFVQDADLKYLGTKMHISCHTQLVRISPLRSKQHWDSQQLHRCRKKIMFVHVWWGRKPLLEEKEVLATQHITTLFTVFWMILMLWEEGCKKGGSRPY